MRASGIHWIDSYFIAIASFKFLLRSHFFKLYPDSCLILQLGHLPSSQAPFILFNFFLCPFYLPPSNIPYNCALLSSNVSSKRDLK